MSLRRPGGSGGPGRALRRRGSQVPACAGTTGNLLPFPIHIGSSSYLRRSLYPRFMPPAIITQDCGKKAVGARLRGRVFAHDLFSWARYNRGKNG